MPPTRPFHRQAGFIRNLTVLPTELLFKVLDDLPVYATLKLACSENERINECILKHGKYSALFSSGQAFETLKRYFKLYDEVYTVVQLRKLEEQAIIALDISMDSAGHLDALSGSMGAHGAGPLNLSWISVYLHSRIWEVLQTAEKHLSVLNHFIDNPKHKLGHVWDLSTIDSLEDHWRTIRYAEIALNTVKSKQIIRLAELLEKYPNLLVLSGAMEQEFCGWGYLKAQHVAFRYRAMARKCMLPQVFSKGFRGASLFAPNTLPIIPTSHSLKVLLAGLEQYPCHVAEELRRDARSQGTEKRQYHHTYPSDIEDDIRTALSGMGYVYINPSNPRFAWGPSITFRRTANTPYSVPFESCEGKHMPGSLRKYGQPFSVKSPRNHNREAREEQKMKMAGRLDGQPHFCIPVLVPKEPVDGNERLLNRGLPHNERELAWLEAYLRVVQYMSEKLDIEV